MQYDELLFEIVGFNEEISITISCSLINRDYLYLKLVAFQLQNDSCNLMQPLMNYFKAQ